MHRKNFISLLLKFNHQDKHKIWSMPLAKVKRLYNFSFPTKSLKLRIPKLHCLLSVIPHKMLKARETFSAPLFEKLQQSAFFIVLTQNEFFPIFFQTVLSPFQSVSGVFFRRFIKTKFKAARHDQKQKGRIFSHHLYNALNVEV